MFSARTEKGPVTPSMVKGCIENLSSILDITPFEKRYTYKLKIMPHKPVLNTTSIVPQVMPVNTYKSLANVIPGKIFVKNT